MNLQATNPGAVTILGTPTQNGVAVFLSLVTIGGEFEFNLDDRTLINFGNDAVEYGRLKNNVFLCRIERARKIPASKQQWKFNGRLFVRNHEIATFGVYDLSDEAQDHGWICKEIHENNPTQLALREPIGQVGRIYIPQEQTSNGRIILPT